MAILKAVHVAQDVVNTHYSLVVELSSTASSNLATQVKNKISFYIFWQYGDESLSTQLDLELCRRHICGHVYKDVSKRI